MIGSVKLFCLSTLVLSAAVLCLSTGCKPQAPDLERLRAVETSNEQLRQKISDMQKRIREAGEHQPGLQEQIEERRQAINQTLARKTELRRKETALKLRYIELESRLKEFRAEFSDMQNKIVNSNTENAQP
jgi:chromosome segregation ATPase